MRIGLACLLWLAAALASPAWGQTPALETEDQKALYTLGFTTARTLEIYDLKAEELDVVLRGLRDGVLKHEPAVPVSEYRSRIGSLRDARRKSALAARKKEAWAFLDELAAEPGAVRTESGIVIQKIRAGTGESPKESDRVRVHYHGTLPDGTIFDSSVQRGKPATFSLRRVIKCWTEGVQTMKVGGKSRLGCPPDLAYGDRGSPPRIPPGSALVFEVELLEIEK